jgi:ribonucleoside-diphosphate reductase alpha chain
MRALIDMAADRGPFIDQSQSLNLFMESPNIGQLSSMYFYAWKRKLKTTYYLRSRPATRIAKATVERSSGLIPSTDPQSPQMQKQHADRSAVSCSLENPESCEACQ